MTTQNHEQEFELEPKGDKPIIAICYDFDKTLTPDDMQAQGFIQALKNNPSEFWKDSNELARLNNMDQNLAYMYMMKTLSEGKVLFTKDKLVEYGKDIQLFNGVQEWFSRINAYAEQKGVLVEHYIISSGLKEMIDGSSIASEFKRVYATSFYYNEKGVAVWPAQAVNYTNKTQFLFRIAKGVLDVNDQRVNDSFSPENIRIPFRNMVYIGDSDTDIPCMKLVNSLGGYSVGVYDPVKKDKSKVYKMTQDNRIRYFAPADYSTDQGLDRLLKLIIDKTAYNEQLEDLANQYKNEAINARKGIDDDTRQKQDLIMALENSETFSTTHYIIHQLRQIPDDQWTQRDLNALFTIANENSQVRYILSDKDVRSFYRKLLPMLTTFTREALMVEDVVNNSPVTN